MAAGADAWVVGSRKEDWSIRTPKADFRIRATGERVTKKRASRVNGARFFAEPQAGLFRWRGCLFGRLDGFDRLDTSGGLGSHKLFDLDGVLYELADIDWLHLLDSRFIHAELHETGTLRLRAAALLALALDGARAGMLI
ncbi:MAG: hypothetical protein WCK89_04780 [bacterium]